jgi:hypothetical protein
LGYQYYKGHWIASARNVRVTGQEIKEEFSVVDVCTGFYLQNYEFKQATAAFGRC